MVSESGGTQQTLLAMTSLSWDSHSPLPKGPETLFQLTPCLSDALQVLLPSSVPVPASCMNFLLPDEIVGGTLDLVHHFSCQGLLLL